MHVKEYEFDYLSKVANVMAKYAVSNKTDNLVSISSNPFKQIYFYNSSVRMKFMFRKNDKLNKDH